MNRFVFLIILLLPSLGAAFWTVQPAVSAYVAVRSVVPPPFPDSDLNDAETVLTYKRDLQREFASLDIHVPLEDIALGKTAVDDASRLQNLNVKACRGKADLYLWLPLRFRLPVVGDKIIDRCWRYHWTKAG